MSTNPNDPSGGDPNAGQQPPPQQPPPQQPPPQQQGGQQGGSEGGLDPKIGGLLAYLLFGWIGGLIMLLTQSHREVKFHGAQSILFSVALIVVYIALSIVGTIFGFIPGLGWLGGLVTLALMPLIWLASMVLWIFLMIKGYNLEHFKLPLVGDWSEQLSKYHQQPAS